MERSEGHNAYLKTEVEVKVGSRGLEDEDHDQSQCNGLAYIVLQ